MLIHNADITGSLTINNVPFNSGSFSGSFRGDGSQLTGITGATTASYVEYSNVANKPALVSSSAQIIGYGIFATTGSNQFNGSQTITGSLTVTGGITATITGSATSASYVEYANVANKPALVSSSAQISFNGITDKPALVSSSAQIVEYGVFATTGSNLFNGSQTITGSLTVTGQVIAQTLNVQQVTSSIVFSSGSNVFGNSLSNTQQFTGSVSVTGSLTVNGTALVPTTRTITINGTSQDLSANRTFSVGTVTSVATTGPITGGTITGTGTIGINQATSTIDGYLSSTDWSTFNNKENAISAGTTAQYFRGDKTFQTLNTTAVAEGTNLYYTEARVSANTNVAANTAARHNAVTLGTANGLSLSTQQLSLGLASTSANGALSSTDWNTFNGKQNALTNPVTGTGTSGQVAYFTGTSAISSESNLFWDASNNRLGINQSSPLAPLHVGSEASSDDANVQRWDYAGSTAYQLILKQTVTSGVVRWNFSQINNSTAFNNVLVLDRGNVGIGTANPARRLQVEVGSTAQGGQNWSHSNGTVFARLGIVNPGVDNNTEFGSASNNDLVLLTVNTERMRITTGGNVGIGITTPSNTLTIGSNAHTSPSDTNRILNWYTIGSELHNSVIPLVVGNNNSSTSQPQLVGLSLFNRSTTDNTWSPAITFGGLSTSGGYMNGAAGIAAQLPANSDNNFRGGNLVFYTSGIGATKGLVEKVRIQHDGNVGINTTSPTSRLSVCSTTACSTVVNVQGCAGQLFSVTDNLVGDIFSVSDISGIPILNVNSNGTVCVDSRIAVGANHTVSGTYASVTGGRNNIASGGQSTVSGGYCNTACSLRTNVAGGGFNTASSYYATVGGGRQNCSTGNFSTVAGGFQNTASGYGSVVAGGGGCSSGNSATASRSTVSGGVRNTASGCYSSVGGGRENCSTGNFSTVAGGFRNTASGYGSVVAGGGACFGRNCATARYATISGGRSNTASAYYATVGGGGFNTASGCYSTVSGGYFNCASGFGSSVAGGKSNTASAVYAAVLNGFGNSACFNFSSVGGGVCQTTSGCNEFRVQNLSKASGTFRINHPDPSKKYTHYLSHSFVESPTAGDNIYRYKVNVVNGQATIALPSYYKYLNENDQIWVTPQGHFGVGYGEVNAEQTQVTIYGNADGEYNVLLIGTRKDIDAVEYWQGTETYK